MQNRIQHLTRWLKEMGVTNDVYDPAANIDKRAQHMPDHIRDIFKDKGNLSSEQRTTLNKAVDSGLMPDHIRNIFDQKGEVTPGQQADIDRAARSGLMPESIRTIFDEPAETTEPGRMPDSIKNIFGEQDPNLKELEEAILYEGWSLRRGVNNETVRPLVTKVQKRLNDKGYKLPKHGQDGVFGKETEEAIKVFQRNNKNFGLVESGRVDSLTLMALLSSSDMYDKKLNYSEHSPKKNNSSPSRISGMPGRTQLSNMTPGVKEKLYKLTQAEVGGQGEKAQQAFMETVANRAAITGRTIDSIVSDKRYYEPIVTKGNGNVNNLASVSESVKGKYDKILKKVIEGSNITNGATHNASGSVAKNWKTKYDGEEGTRVDIGGETFYSKTFEQKRIKSKLKGLGQTIPVSSGPSASGTYTLPKFSFVSVPCTNAAALAIKESREVWDNGNISESDPRAEEPIQKYYAYTSKYNSYSRNVDRWGKGKREFGKYKGKRRLNPVKERNSAGVATNWFHWSAVYVSWVMGQFDGEGAKWYIHEGHPGYIRAFQRNRRKIQKNPSDHKGKMYYVWFTREEMKKYGLKLEPGDVVGRHSHCDIYIGNNQIIGGNTCAKSEYTGGKKKNCKGTSGPQPLRWKAGFGIIKRVRVTGPGSSNAGLV